MPDEIPRPVHPWFIDDLYAKGWDSPFRFHFLRKRSIVSLSLSMVFGAFALVVRRSRPNPAKVDIRPLSKLGLLAKIALFGIFIGKFFDHMHHMLSRFYKKLAQKLQLYQPNLISKEVY